MLLKCFLSLHYKHVNVQARVCREAKRKTLLKAIISISDQK